MAKKIAGDKYSQPEYQVNVRIGGDDPGTTGLLRMLQALLVAGDDRALFKAAKQIVDTVDGFE